ncbi:thioredoxin domain-containing protein [cf. Phormidesmis sp. LEGE 11477]|uniref:DsbA family protein n=1 Tax=cf. Phormidesmis sp. LEGE 11477 TaxID=1828680 RepID=UPI00188200BF|nr:thioredoxin domain-containing protein [cf. Phormidesmis sp. LEGE 11477]MBE9063628.1 thioredoxin domain-containing protein [cf. Phormidesmis sp. LEGE 11477]
MAIPIPSRRSGYRLGDANAPVMVEVFFDLECPFSKKGWETVMKVKAAYSLEQIYWAFQPMTLGNHRQSWDATKAAIAVANLDTHNSDPQKFIEFVSYLFSKQADFANEAWKDKTQTEFHTFLSECAAAATNHKDKAQFLNLLNSEETYAKARIPARFATVRGVWSTPTFFINGAEATTLSSGSSVQDWQSVIDDLL